MFGEDIFDTSVIPKESLAHDAKQYLKHILENLKVSQKVSRENEKHFQQRNKDIIKKSKFQILKLAIKFF